MMFLSKRDRPAQIARRVPLRRTGGNRIPEHLSAVPVYAVRSIERATGFDAAQYGEQFRCIYLANGTGPQPREYFTLQPPDDLSGVVCNPTRRKFDVPFARYCLEAILGRCLADLLHHTRVNAIGQVLASFTAPLACLRE